MDTDNNLITYKNSQEILDKIANDDQTLQDIKDLTSTKVTDQLKVFLIAQARSELKRVVTLTKFLDKLESSFMDKVNYAIENDSLTLKQYTNIIGLITELLNRSNTIILNVLKDDSLTALINTTIYASNDTSVSMSTVSQLKDPQSRERVRNVIKNILNQTQEYEDLTQVNNDSEVN